MIERFVKLESCNKFVLKSFCSQKIKMLDTASNPSHNINDVHAVEGAFDWARRTPPFSDETFDWAHPNPDESHPSSSGSSEKNYGCVRMSLTHVRTRERT